MKKIKCILDVGHKETSPGAINETHKISEYQFNSKLAKNIKHIFTEKNIQDISIQIIHRTDFKNLPYLINSENPDFVVSLHCNAFNKKASGTETLYYYKSKKSKEIADIFNKNIFDVLNLTDRGIKGKTEKDRGGHLLKNTKAPCIIIEPFFIDNDKDVTVVAANYINFLHSIKNSIIESANYLRGV